MQSYETHRLTWEGLAIEIRYCPDWSEGYRAVIGKPLAHLTVDADRNPLPFTETGYLSVFEPAVFIDAEGGPVAYVQDWLKQAALAPEWQAAKESRQQLSLF